MSAAVSYGEYYESTNDGKYIPVITFHRFDDSSELYINMTPHDFESLLIHLKSMGYTTITNTELEAYLNGESYLPEKPILFTVDDAYESFYKNAFPLLKKYNMKASLFVITSEVGKIRAGEPISNWDQIREMSKSPLIEIGSHAHRLHHRHGEKVGEEAMITNKNLSGLSINDEQRRQMIVNDLKESNTIIYNNLGFVPSSFAYPYGAYDHITEEAVAEVGYRMVYTTDKGVNHVYTDKLRIMRYGGSSKHSPKWYTDEFAKEEKMLSLYNDMRTSVYKYDGIWTALTFLNGDQYDDSPNNHKETRYEIWRDGTFIRNFGDTYRNFTNEENFAIATDSGEGLSGKYHLKIISVTHDLAKIVHYKEIEF